MLRAGDVVVLLYPGAVETKRRPAVVLSSDTYHASRPDVILGLVTTRSPEPVCPTDHVIVDWRVAGLRAPSTFRTFLVTVPRSAVGRTIGRLSDRDWAAVRACAGVALTVADA